MKNLKRIRLINDAKSKPGMMTKYLTGVLLFVFVIGSLSVSATPAARFEAIPSVGEAPLNVTFVDQCAVNTTGWNWTMYDTTRTSILVSFNYTVVDNFTNTSFIPTYRYEYPGIYPVDLVAYNATNPSDNELFSDNVTVVPPALSANFTAVYVNGSAPMNVSFVDQSEGNISSWNWTFGDGTGSSIDRNPEYRYNESGVYTVRLNVLNDFYDQYYSAIDNLTRTTTLDVHVGAPLYPVVKFATTPNNGTAPLNVSFIDQTDVSPETPVAYRYYWDFDDGTVADNATRNIDHAYSQSGTYHPSLIITSTINTSHVVYGNATLPVIVENSTAISNFTAVYRNGTAPFNVSFIDQSTSSLPLIGWLWNFGDGNSSIDQNPEHQYSLPGIYSVNLTIMVSDNSTDIEEKTDYIVVNNGTGPVASFIPVPGEGQAPLNISFYDQSAGDVVGWNWTFGDGTANDTSQNPVHQYNASNIYQVNLTVRDSYDRENTVWQNVTVLPADLPFADFTWLPKNETAPLNVSFIDQSVIDPAWAPYVSGYLWDFGDMYDPVQQSSKNPVHYYSHGGVYNVTMWLSCGIYGNSTISQNVTILDGSAPSAQFIATPRSGPRPLTVSFIDMTQSSAPVTSWNWSFGDGSLNATDENPAHQYTQVGNFSVALTVLDSLGREGSVLYPDLINVTESDTTMRAGFSAIPSYGNPPLLVSFTDTSKYTGNVSRTWNFGDQTTAIGTVNPTHVYAIEGNYSVNLTIWNEFDRSSNTTEICVESLKANYTYQADPVNSRNVTFTDISKGFPLKWFWTFGDGYTAQTQNPTHIYAASGTYPVALYIQNGPTKDATIQQVSVTV